jgi:hypothetical protein
MSRTQCDRILKASRRFNGVCQADFSGAETVDGGPIITRVAARLYDLEQQGHRFEHIGTRHKTKVFRLIEAEGSADERRAATCEESGPASAGSTRAGVSAPLSPEVVEAEQEKPNTTTPLFKAGKPQYDWSTQGELDAA